MPLNRDGARELLNRVLTDLWNRQHRPILGSHLKATLQIEAARGGAEFDERSLGFANFGAFMLAHADITAVKFRAGTDMLIVPAEHRDVLADAPAQRLPHIRPDIWRAFVTFPVPGKARGYDPNEDRIVVLPLGTIRPGLIPIEPITRETQVQWRKDFIDSLGAASPLAYLRDRVDTPSGLHEFTRVVGSDPVNNRRWKEIKFQRVYDIVKTWAQAAGLSDTKWVDLSEVRDDQRKRLYAALDRIPVEYLMDLKIPLKWLIEKESKP